MELEKETLLLNGKSDSVASQRGMSIRRALMIPLLFLVVCEAKSSERISLLFTHGILIRISMVLVCFVPLSVEISSGDSI